MKQTVNKIEQYDHSPETRPYGDLYTLQSAAWVPFARSLITSALWSIPVLVILMALAVNKVLPFWKAGIWVLLLVWSAVNVYWWSRENGHRERFINVLEWRLQRDLDGDGDIGLQGEPEEIVVTVTKETPGGNLEGVRTRKPPNIPRELLTEFADGVVKFGDPITVRQWTGDGKPFSREQFDAMRDWLIELGGVAQISEKDARVGYKMTATGRDVLARFTTGYQDMRLAPPTPPQIKAG